VFIIFSWKGTHILILSLVLATVATVIAWLSAHLTLGGMQVRPVMAVTGLIVAGALYAVGFVVSPSIGVQALLTLLFLFAIAPSVNRVTSRSIYRKPTANRSG
jgi:hypothetical protein